MTRPARQLAAAAAQYGHAREPEPDWQFDDRVEEIADDIAADPERVAEIDSDIVTAWKSKDDPTEAFSALADMHNIEPMRLLGTDTLTRLYRLAKTFAAMRQDAIDQQARDEAEREAAEFPRGFRGG